MNHALTLIDWLDSEAEARHAWLSVAAAQIEAWKLEESMQDNDPPEEPAHG